MFSISDKVVCVDDTNFYEPERFSALPVKGQIYVVRGFSMHGGDPTPAVLLVGIHSHHITRHGCEVGFWHTRFRKLADIKAENALARCANAPVRDEAKPRSL